MFDAGAIEARLTVDLSGARKDLDKFKADVEAFEHKPHKIRLTAEFDNSTFGRARQMFAQLDNQLSRDAANRLRSSPQGSVLGALNALFSPHPVTGSPTAVQSGTQGALGKIVNAPSGGVVRETTTTKTVLDDVIGLDKASLQAKGEQAGKTVSDAVKDGAAREASRGGGGWLSGLLSFSRVKAASGGGGGGEEASFLDKGLVGGIGPGILGLDFLKASLVGLGGAALGGIPALVGGGAALGVLGGGAIGAYKGSGQLQDAVKQLGGMSSGALKGASASLVMPLITAVKQLDVLVKNVTPDLKQLFAGAVPFIEPLVKGLSGLVTGLFPGLLSMMKSVLPVVRVIAGFFSYLGGALGSMFKVIGTVIGPSSQILKSLLDVVANLLPFLVQVGKLMATALAGPFSSFAAVLSGLLPTLVSVAGILAQFAGAVLSDLSGGLQLVVSVLKIITPSLNQLTGVLGQVFNTLESKGSFAQLGDILEDLATPIGNLINALVRGLLPVLPSLANAFNTIVNAMSTVGVAALTALLPAITGIVEVLAGVIHAIPPQTLTDIVMGLLLLSGAMKVMNAIGIATSLTMKGLSVAMSEEGLAARAVAAATALWNGVTTVAAAIAKAWAVATDGETIALAAMYLWENLVTIATKAWAVAEAILDIALDAGPIGLIIIAVAALGVGVYELYKHWSTVWAWIKRIAEDAWQFISNGWGKYLFGPIGLLVTAATDLYRHWDTIWGWIKGVAQDAWTFFWDGAGKYLLPLLGPAGLIALGAIELYQHWRQVWGFMQDVASGFYQYMWSDFGAKIYTFLVDTMPGWVTDMWDGMKHIWDDITGWFGGLPGDILHALGIHSPPDWAVKAGEDILTGLFGWSSSKESQILSRVRAMGTNIGAIAGGAVTGNVVQWITAALKATGLPMSWLQPMEQLVSQESGGNPNAVDPILVDGEHAEGVAQMLPSTFLEYGTPGTSIWNPVAELIASLRYIVATYGTPYNIPNLFSGHYVGYAEGGPITEPILGVGSSGTIYAFGENTRRGEYEWVGPMRGSGGGKLADNLSIMLPEGQTLTDALHRLDFQLHAAQMQGFLG